MRDEHIEPVTNAKPKQLSTMHMDTWSALLERTFPEAGGVLESLA